MMSLLLLTDTSSDGCAIAVFAESKIIVERRVLATRGHSEIFFALLEEVLSESKVQLTEITGFGVCTGPGNFTSLRVAIAAIRGLSLSCGKPSVGVSAFDTLALKEGHSLVLIKGRGENFYGQEFLNGTPLKSPESLTIESISKNKFSSNCTVIGYQCKKVSLKIGSSIAIPKTNVDLLQLARISEKRLAQEAPRPTPLYIQ